MRLFIVALVTFLFSIAGNVKADKLHEFNAQVELANQPYKSSLFYLRTGNAGVASLELMSAIENWEKVVTQFKSEPPEEFKTDAAWGQTLEEISSSFRQASMLISEGKAKEARQTLLPIRDTLHELRKRNGVSVLADCIYEMNDHMSVLFEYRHNAPNFNDPMVRNSVEKESQNYIDALKRCHEQASPTLHKNEDFKSIFSSTIKSAGTLIKPIHEKNAAAFINVLRELKSFDVIIALRWG